MWPFSCRRRYATKEDIKIMTAALDRLTADVAAQNTLMASAVTLIGGLAAQIRAAVATGDDDALNALADSLEAQDNSLAAAISANTPATSSTGTPPASGGTASTPAGGSTAAAPVTGNSDGTAGSAAISGTAPADGNATGQGIDPATGQSVGLTGGSVQPVAGQSPAGSSGTDTGAPPAPTPVVTGEPIAGA